MRRLRAKFDALFDGCTDLAAVVEQVALLDAQLLPNRHDESPRRQRAAGSFGAAGS